MISHLPEGVIVNILSFLPLKEAARTSVLSSQWPDLWKHASNLVFVRKCYADKMAERYGLGHEYREWVDSVLKSHKAFTLKEFTISIVVKELTQCAITKWHKPLNSSRMEMLELNFRLLGGKDGAVLEEMLGEFSCDELKSVKELRVKNIEVSWEVIKMFLRKWPFALPLTIRGSIRLRGSLRFVKDFTVCSICPTRI